MPTGNCFLILDGHGSQIISCKMLENAQTNNIILLCPPRHTAYFLQPFDRSFFKSLKKYFKRACDKFIRANPGKRIKHKCFGTDIEISGFCAIFIKNIFFGA